MKTKIFSYDLDGTLLMSNNKVHEDTKKAFIEVHKKHGINVLNTGRGLIKVLPLLDEFKGIDFFICSNGCLIYDVAKKTYKIVGKLNPEVFELMYEYAKNNDLIITLDTSDFNGTYIPKNDSGELPSWIKGQDIMDFSRVNVSNYETMHKVANDPNNIITQVAIRNPRHIAPETTKYFDNLFKNKYSVYLTNSIYTDVNPLGVSKWNGLKAFLEIYDLKDSTIYAFGDSGNDVEMLKNSHFGYAMGNATSDAKEVAYEVIGDYNTGAIGHKLNEIINNN
ncbi:HAD-IIB family hydrolase [Mycoplasma tauri]|uniref:HAD family hydrolase n=1 Tax=Mycoplasma tauri TaxID=547987 RepID=A0A953NCV3_9MOLU|nr:HAD-IIB family hydrolase [Mycoplasma tauri]MBZ4195260.1 HAD family hydrolase [Mycoplasma tauri]MBZ4218207.1 HAD family hydrolase [Mycoplasma tauri]MBZ4226941.1 HAD family hydrolase [Mycoplasma tauri]